MSDYSEEVSLFTPGYKGLPSNSCPVHTGAKEASLDGGATASRGSEAGAHEEPKGEGRGNSAPRQSSMNSMPSAHKSKGKHNY
jgi:hypothetical protein